MSIATMDPETMSVEQFMESDVPASAWLGVPAPDHEPDQVIVMKLRDRLGRKFAVQDIIDGGETGSYLYDVAQEWLSTQKDADFDWLRDLAQKYAKGGGLTDKQACGVLNCLVAQERRRYENGDGPGPTRDTSDQRRSDGTWSDKVGHVAYPGLPESNGFSPRADQGVATAARSAAYDLDEDERNAAEYDAFLAVSVSQGYYTVVVPPKWRYTFRLGGWKDDRRREGMQIRWISYLRGASNVDDYTSCAFQLSTGELMFLQDFRQNEKLRATVEFLLGRDANREEMRTAYALESGKCARCGRMLTTPESIIERGGIGPECIKKMGM